MRIIESIDVTAGMVASSSVPEDDCDPWSASASYAVDAKVMRSHYIYQAVQAVPAGTDPATDSTATWWSMLSATNMWRPFDQQLSPVTAWSADDIAYSIVLTKKVDAIAMFRLSGLSVRVRVLNGSGAVQYDESFALASSRTVNGWWDYFFAPFETNPSKILTGIPGFVGNTVEITISGSGTKTVGEILLGNLIVLGTSLDGTEPGFTDFSVKTQNDWGDWQITERGYSRTVDYKFTAPKDDVGRILSVVARNRARMCVFDAGEGTEQYGTTILGFIASDGLSAPLTTGISFLTLSVEGLSEE